MLYASPTHGTSGTRDRRSRPSLKVLLADDHADTREAFRIYLEGIGLQVWSAADGLDAIRIARAVLPDVIVLDVQMPAFDGHEVVRVLRADRHTASIPILLLTGAVGPAQPSPELGAADAAMTKPCLPAELLAAIRATRRLAGRSEG
jgi:CheY-like chemotaxis protein